MDQAKSIVNKIYQGILKDSANLSSRLNAKLNDEVINCLAGLSPRAIKLFIEFALGKAALAKRNNLMAVDFDIPTPKKSFHIGFI